jgi:hypothetical protein
MKSTWKIINSEKFTNQDDMSVRSMVMDKNQYHNHHYHHLIHEWLAVFPVS